jgi:hypothetical protein
LPRARATVVVCRGGVRNKMLIEGALRRRVRRTRMMMQRKRVRGETKKKAENGGTITMRARRARRAMRVMRVMRVMRAGCTLGELGKKEGCRTAT